MQTYILICLIVFFAGFTQGLSGFGSILLSLPLLAIFLDIKIVIPLVAIYGVSITIILLVQLQKYLDWQKIFPLFLGALPGIPIGVYFLKKLDKGMIQWILGIMLISYSLYSLFFRSTNKGIREGWAYLFGFLSGCLGGALSASGPAVIVYTSLQAWSKDKVKVTLQGFFMVSGMVVIFFHALSGLTTVTVLRFFLVSLPLLFLGTYTGSFFYGKIKEKNYKRVMLILLAFLGGFIIYRAT
ncbi:MAG: sulfite exporter TauE/SafE family protein [Deltaproteobacteria bacterium]|nr:sulfite exporter TauE/SafE family protein [Deltaproteobacteria bacterium]MBW2105917.1 sulfite exporter TauE/SafE family protein [Deltaproteobacteria bacterium]